MPIVTVRGCLRPDGTLELEDLPTLPPGPVSVTIRTLERGSARAGARDVAAGRQADEAASDMASYDNLPDPNER